jgi:hypothetical protein
MCNIKGIIVSKGKTNIGFDEIQKMGKGHLMAAKMEVDNNYSLVGGGYTFKNVMDYHKKLGHPSIKGTRKAAKANDIKLTGKVKKCKSCILAKLKRTNISKLNPNKAKKKGERLCIDISWIKKSSIRNNKYWLLIEDEYTSMKWSFFDNRKPEAGKIIIEFIKSGRNKICKFLRLDNSGGKQAMVLNMKKEELEISIEFTSPHTPEQHRKVERSFATLWGKTRAMLNGAGFPDELKEKLWAKCAFTVTKFNNLMIKEEEKNPYELFYKEKLDLGSKLRKVVYALFWISREPSKGNLQGI